MSDKYVFFWGGPFSNWDTSPFVTTLFGKQYQFNCAEQYMMLSKALTFGDEIRAYAIMNTSDPQKQKAHGRKVANFDTDKWAKVRFDLFLPGLYAKFYQNQKHLKYLLSTGEKMIVEASPYDTIWGIGMGELEPGIEDEKNWKGENLLGKALMIVRDSFRNGELIVGG